MDENYINEKLNEIFFPIGIRHIKEFKENHYRLAYYTSEETAKKILQNREFWMRNACLMNDYREIQYGIDLLAKTINIFSNDKRFESHLAKVFMSAINDFFGNNKCEYLSWKLNTYLTSFTEHKYGENCDGRLSMWRAYGGNNGVAIILKKGYLFEGMQNRDYFVKDVFLSRVEYVTEKEMVDKIFEVLNSITNYDSQQFLLQFIQSMKYGETIIYNKFRNMLSSAIVSLKHPGFREEAEWRAVAHAHNLENKENCENFEIENVKGLEQLVFKIKFKADDLFNAIDSIIIGPKLDIGTKNITFNVFTRIMMDTFQKSREEVEKKIRFSSIPYRPM